MRYEGRRRRDRRNRRGSRRRRRRMAWIRAYAAAVLSGAGAVLLFAAVGFAGTLLSPAKEAAGAESQSEAVSEGGLLTRHEEDSGYEAEPGKEERAAERMKAQRLNEQNAEMQTVFRTRDQDQPLIVIDPGHGGMDEGCIADGIMEKDINLAIALRLRNRLENQGYQVLMTRTDDALATKEQRAEAANRWEADAFVSIHQNTYEDAGPAGIETWYDGTDESGENERLARLIHESVVKSTGARGRELKGDADFVVTGWTKMPACLIETGFLSSPEERRKLANAEYQEKLAEGITAGIDAYFHPKIMYLTFDDGPSAENTAAILDVLKARNIKATFFVIGENVRKNPETARRIATEGHTIGIHCNRHDYEVIYESTDSYLKDFEEAYQTVYEVTGVEAKLFRFPGGSINAYNKAVYQDIIKTMTDRGFVYFDWNASLEDAVKKSEPEELAANAKETAMGRKRVVMLAHDIVRSTALCLEEVIGQFPEYRLEPLTPEVEPVQFRP